jgi:uncharacterized RDD family membrane protein YckC
MRKPVGFWERVFASILDFLCVSLPIMILGSLIFGWELNGDLQSTIYFVYGLIVPVIWHGYIVGKRLVSIRVVKTDGTDVGIWTMIKRTIIGGVVYALSFGILLIVSAFMFGIREDGRSVHDFIAGTYVTKLAPGE